jgi:hypothetical protein
MTRKQQGVGLAAAVAGFCLAVLLVVIALVTRNGAEDDSAAIGFPLFLAGLIVAGALLALGWWAVSRSRQHSGR